jgi:carboxymethylenebutenolidase
VRLQLGGVILFPAIFQHTPPIRRAATWISGHGYIVVVPEIYHEHLPKGTVLATDNEGKAKGNELKRLTKISTLDNDVQVVVDYLHKHSMCNGRVGCVGFCIGGHLALRAALNSNILCSASMYPTDVHTGTLGNPGADTLERLNDMKGEVVLVFGRQDPHIPPDGRLKIYQTFQKSSVHYSWHEFNADHSFMTDEDPSGRFNPADTDICYKIILDLFARHL